MDATKIAEAYALIRASKRNLNKKVGIEEKYVNQFHATLDILESESGQSLAHFRIPASELQCRFVFGSSEVPEATIYGEPECATDLFVAKVDAVLTFFDRKPHTRQNS
jgi:hypothetical protein